MQFAERLRWIPFAGHQLSPGVDGISVLFVGLTAFLTLVVIYSWDTVRHQSKAVLMCLLAHGDDHDGHFRLNRSDSVLRLLGTDADPQLFPDQALGAWDERQYAALKFVLYTLLGSVFMLVGILPS